MAASWQFELTDSALTRGKDLIGRLVRDEHFGNARVIRNFAEFIQQEKANRLAAITEPSREQLVQIEESDVIAASNDLKLAGGNSSRAAD
jgi:hypothetical protein